MHEWSKNEIDTALKLLDQFIHNSYQGMQTSPSSAPEESNYQYFGLVNMLTWCYDTREYFKLFTSADNRFMSAFMHKITW